MGRELPRRTILIQGNNTLRKLRGARTTLWDRESPVNRDLTNGRGLVRTSEGGNIAATSKAVSRDEVTPDREE